MELLKIVPLEEKHIEDAALIFTINYSTLRKSVPYMPVIHEDKNRIMESLAYFVKNFPGVAAIQNGKLVGYLTGVYVPELKSSHPGVYCPEWAHGAIGSNVRDIYRKMYEKISAVWIEHKHIVHALTILYSQKDVIDAWFWNSFGLLTVDVVRPMKPVDCYSSPDINVRQATLEDVDALLPIMQEHVEYYPKAPIFLPVDEILGRKEVEDILNEQGVIIWLAERNNNIVGFMKCRNESTDACHIVRDEKTASIWGAYVKDEVRNSGIGSLLLNEIINWASKNGFERCSLDFEAANIYGSKFWLRHFEPVCYSLIRHVNDKILDK